MTKIAEKYGDMMYGVAKIIVGLMFVLHGSQKFGMLGDGMSIAAFAGFANIPIWLAYLVALTELVGGVCLVLGLFSRWAADALAVIMVAALAMVHFPQGMNPLTNGGELALAYLAFLLVVIKLGNGKWSLEQAIFKKEH
jgi:putative oxidoreductase